MAISPSLGIALILVCVLAFALVERDRQRRIARMEPQQPLGPTDAAGSDEGGVED